MLSYSEPRVSRMQTPDSSVRGLPQVELGRRRQAKVNTVMPPGHVPAPKVTMREIRQDIDIVVADLGFGT